MRPFTTVWGGLWLGRNLFFVEALHAEQVVLTDTKVPPTLGGDWDLAKGPSENSTHNLVFDGVGSFLQHWPNTRYRNGE